MEAGRVSVRESAERDDREAVRCWKCRERFEISQPETQAACPRCGSRVALHRLNIPVMPSGERAETTAPPEETAPAPVDRPPPEGPSHWTTTLEKPELSPFVEVGRPEASIPEQPRPGKAEPVVAKPHYQSLQAFRGIAALGVLVFHLPLVAREEMGARYTSLAFPAGEVGVDFFFVLSGFIIASIHRHDLGVPSAAPRFLLKRIFRIYPLVFLACAIKLTYVLAMGDASLAAKADPYLVLSSFTLLPLPNNGDYLIGVMWTLSHEMLFYTLFLVPIIFGLRIALVGASLWVLLILSLNLTRHAYPPEALVMSFLARPCNLEFLLGCGVAFLPSLAARPRLAWGVMGMAGAWLAMTLLVSERYVTSDFNIGAVDLGYRLAWGPGFALLIYGTVALEAHHRFRVPAVLLLVGNASFSIYLFHTSAMHLLMKLAGKSGLPVESMPVWVTLGTVAVLTLLVGLAIYFFIEKRMLACSHKLIPRLLSKG